MTLMFRGQSLRGEALRQEGHGAPAGRLLAPTHPLLGAAFLVTWIARAQDVGWSLLTSPARGTRYLNAQDALWTALQAFRLPVGLVLPAGALALIQAIAVETHVGYLDRVALRLGVPERDTPPRT